MHPSLRCFSARVHQPLIRFLGKRAYPNTPDVPHAHPAAPLELKQEFINKISSKLQGPDSASTQNTYHDFWEAPPRFWKPRVRHMEDEEMDAIMSGGASSY